ncbi:MULTISPECIES: hypothetical protein [unclassified Acinetobacter]|uniref:hypothetical protein n=1 Tax=unclassified Acinetobacter TaxID=196816 RepID=UPI00244C17A6|nr:MULTISPECIES: hypothetical protein [unclassified Acinetobacter]MDH0031747.1 hypothetical protein [Acinetobacter sp. GD04021]MDH0886062.1 hypothetical protein [Acinetobacter sp. GD03873]MDH1082682.1 hypothetical protein [Acinetobacter sp. GD03983]MDH2189523.1 hypothetical protein [Acinetobacter sp. GD03645]MDH2203646.1 hypothetical protein [Acinetobacter sp. GD03647]
MQKNIEGISTTKILKLANDQGQKIYQIDQSSVNTILPQLNHENQVITDIRNAVSAGKTVTTSEKSINFNGWKGSGYIITDPNSGSGAYMISGGLNGGETMINPTLLIGIFYGFLLAGILTAISMGAVMFPIWVALALVLLSIIIIHLLYKWLYDEYDTSIADCFAAGITIPLFFVSVISNELGVSWTKGMTRIALLIGGYFMVQGASAVKPGICFN